MSPEMFGRIDDVKFQTGAALMENFIATAQGPAENRPGFKFVREVKDSTRRTRLIPFTFSTTQTMVIELGHLYIRFHTSGATLGPGTPAAWSGATAYTVGALVSRSGFNYYCIANNTNQQPPNASFWYALPAGVYEIPSPYTEADLFAIKYVQSGDVMTLVHPTHAPRELRRLGATQWTLTPISFLPSIAAPASLTITPSLGATVTIAAMSGNPTTLTTNVAHGFTPGDSVYISRVAGFTAGFTNGFYVVASIGSGGAAATTLTIANFETGAVVGPGLTGTYSASSGRIQWAARTSQVVNRYVVTSIAGNGIEESAPSQEVETANNLNVSGSFNTLSWAPVSGASRYNVYKLQSGLYGYIGSTDDATFVDDNIAPDLGITPPIYDSTFIGGSIVSVPVTSGGTNYGSATVSTGSGGVIQSVTVLAGGSNYVPAGQGVQQPTLAVSDPTGTGAVLTLTVRTSPPYDITGVTVTNGGSGYSNPTLTIQNIVTNTATLQTGSGANLQANLTAYIPPDPTLRRVRLSVSDSTGVGAVVEPVIVNRVITAVNVVSGGYGYTNPTVVVSEAAGGSGAVFGTPTRTTAQFPGAVSYFEQRRVFAATPQQPQSIWMTRSGTESDLSFSIPIKDDDRINFRVAAREANTIRHIVPLAQLLLLTSSAEWRVSPVNSDVITPTTISVRPQSYVGASNVQPWLVNNSLVYGEARGGHIRELGYSWQNNGYITGDLSIRAAHLFDDFDIVDMCLSKAPQPLLWFVSSSGKLLGLTYIPEQQVGSWHQHTTDGQFESCTTVAEGDEDVLYVVVRRNINNATVRFVERMESRIDAPIENAFFVDCGATYNGANTGATTVTVTGGTNWNPTETLTLTSSAGIFQFPATADVGDEVVLTAADGKKYRLEVLTTASTTSATAKVDRTLPADLRGSATAQWAWARDSIAGLSHLEGKTVSILAEGAVMAQKVVTSGSVTLDSPAYLAHVGLPYNCNLQTMPMSLNIEAFGQGRRKAINTAILRVYRSGAMMVGPDATRLTEAKTRTTEPYGTPPSLRSDEVEVMVTPSWQDAGQVYVRQSNPLPLTVVGMTIEASIGG